jgi:pimeloyl-ACP methyl ester carboxylesterase
VVLLHGWASTSAYWEPLVDKLLDGGHAVWIVDLPGYHPGESLPENFDWTLDSVAAAVAEEISSRQEPGLPAAGAVHVVGHSLGGSVALTLAARHPECVATLTLVGMVPAPPNEGFRSMLSSQLRQGFIDAGTREKLMKAWFGPLEAAEREILGRGFSVPFGVLGASGEAGLQGVDSRDPALVTAPTLVIIGTDDRLRTPVQVQEFVAGSPQRKLAAIPNAGHSVHWEQPAACAKAMEKFWQETRPTAKPAPPRRKMSDI